MPRPNGKRNSAVAPMIYRLVLVLKEVLLMDPVDAPAPIAADCAVLRKSESGTPPFTPNENGWEKAETAPVRNTNRNLVMMMFTD